MIIGAVLFISCSEDVDQEAGSKPVVLRPEVILDSNEPIPLKSGGGDLEGADPHMLIGEDGKYYLYTTGVSTPGKVVVPVYVSGDMVNWEPAQNSIADHPYVYTGKATDKEELRLWRFWSPDVYYLNGKYYMFVSGLTGQVDRDDFLNMSTFVAESDSPLGPFEKFLRILPRIPGGSTRAQINMVAPHSKLARDTEAELVDPNYLHYHALRIDFDLFNDPNTNKTHFVYTGYGNPRKLPDNGNHILICEFKNPEFVEDGDEPAYYYDFDQSSFIHASVPQDWPEFQGYVTTTMALNNEVWMPQGYPYIGLVRGVTEAPALIFKNGYYQLYFSCNTWDSPSYQIATVMTKNLSDLDVSIRKTLTGDNVKFGEFQRNKGSESGVWKNYGSGGIFVNKDGKYLYVFHTLKSQTFPPREIVIKEITW